MMMRSKGAERAVGTAEEYRRVKMCLSKRRIPTEEQAAHEALEHSLKHGPCRYYECPYCGRYHLTSKVG